MSLSVAWPTACLAVADEPPRFNRDIRPILADRCYTCHGPDSGTRKADLRLDKEEAAHESVIVPGDPDSSELIRRVSSEDPDERMPPAESKKPPLTNEQVGLLRGWIKAGAKYELHWAYIRPQRPAVPQFHVAASPGNANPRLEESRLREWPRNDIDRFLLARQVEQGVGPSPEADRTTLIRRLYFDLVGLPPTTRRSMRLSKIIDRTGTSSSWISCWLRRRSANAWQRGGSIWCDSPIPWAITVIRTIALPRTAIT